MNVLVVRLRALVWLPLLLLLAACAQRLPLPTQTPQLKLPLQLHIQRHSLGESRDWLLVIQQEGDALRWSLLDPLGIPLARQLLRDGQWHADGLLPPNAEARELFAALLFALTPAEQLSTLYAGKQWSQLKDERTMLHDASSPWRVRYRQNSRFELDVGPALTYRVAPIAAAAGTRH